MREEKLANGLGWFSIGLGLTQLLAPRWLGRKIGIGDETGLMRALGARETLTGIGVLNPRTQHAGLWGRVVGDAMDLAILGLALRSPGTRRNRAAVATAMVLGVGVLDLVAARMTGNQNRYRF